MCSAGSLFAESCAYCVRQGAKKLTAPLGTMVEPAEVEGIEEQLTVPSRNHPQLVDLWIAIKRSSAGLDWEREFISLAERENAKLSPSGMIQVIPFTERRGWIVARGVNLRAIAADAVELLVRAVVAKANGNLAAVLPKETATQAKSPDSWRQRVRTVLGNGGAISRTLSPEPRRNSEVDIATHR